jgi:hypothetical protein
MRNIKTYLLRRNHRFALWLLLILLTVAIFAFPVHLTLEYHPIQSTYIFDNLPLFGALYSLWVLVLLLLLFARTSGGKNDWEKLALICVFTLVFLNFWTIITPYGRFEDLNHIAHTKYLQEEGEIPLGHPNLSFDFPGIHLIATSVSQITGLGIFAIRTLLLLLHGLLLSTLLYVLFTRSLRSVYAAPLAVLLMIQGNIMLSSLYMFFPMNFGLIFVAAILMLLNRRELALFETTQDRPIMIILFAAATVTHIATAMVILFLLAGIYVMQKLGKENLVNWSTITLCVVIFLAWQCYWAFRTFGGLVGFFPHFVELLFHGELLRYFLVVGEATLGEGVPLWANITRAFWLVLLFGFGSILALRNLVRVKKLSLLEKKEIWGLLGVAMLGIATFVILPGHAYIYRFITYAAFFTVPLVLRFLLNLNYRKWGFTLLLMLFIALSFPTFLVHNGRISIDAFYRYEFSAGEFLEKSYSKGEQLTVFCGRAALTINLYYMPDAYFRTEPDVMVLGGEVGLWHAMEELITSFENSRGVQDTHSIFIFSRRLIVPYEHLLAIEPTHPKWEELLDRLTQTNKIYDNGFVQLYKR